MRRQWYRIENKKDDRAIVDLFDEIGYDPWWDVGISTTDFVKELRAIKASTIELHINSPGGAAFDGVTIYNALRDHDARIVRALGPNHPHTLSRRGSLAHWTGMAGDAVDARDQFTALLGDELRVLGPDHPITLKGRIDLAQWTGQAGDPVGARDQHTALLSDQLRVLGPDHEETLMSRDILADWTGKAGDPVGARDQFAALLPDQLRVLSRYRTTPLYKSLCLAGIFRANLQLEFYFSVLMCHVVALP